MKMIKIITQAAELYSLGINVEKEKEKLKESVEKYGLYATETVEQLKKTEKLINKFEALEKKHIAETEKYADIKSNNYF